MDVQLKVARTRLRFHNGNKYKVITGRASWNQRIKWMKRRGGQPLQEKFTVKQLMWRFVGGNGRWCALPDQASLETAKRQDVENPGDLWEHPLAQKSPPLPVRMKNLKKSNEEIQQIHRADGDSGLWEEGIVSLRSKLVFGETSPPSHQVQETAHIRGCRSRAEWLLRAAGQRWSGGWSAPLRVLKGSVGSHAGVCERACVFWACFNCSRAPLSN